MFSLLVDIFHWICCTCAYHNHFTFFLLVDDSAQHFLLLLHQFSRSLRVYLFRCAHFQAIVCVVYIFLVLVMSRRYCWWWAPVSLVCDTAGGEGIDRHRSISECKNWDCVFLILFLFLSLFLVLFFFFESKEENGMDHGFTMLHYWYDDMKPLKYITKGGLFGFH